MTHKIEKSEEFLVLKCWMIFFESWRFGRPLGGLGIKNCIFRSQLLDPVPDAYPDAPWPKMLFRIRIRSTGFTHMLKVATICFYRKKVLVISVLLNRMESFTHKESGTRWKGRREVVGNFFRISWCGTFSAIFLQRSNKRRPSMRYSAPGFLCNLSLYRYGTKDLKKKSKFWCIGLKFAIFVIFSLLTYCSTTGKPTHLFRTKCVSLDSV